MKFPIKDVDLFASVVIEKERIVFSASEYGKDVCALVPIEDYLFLQSLTDSAEGNEAIEILNENELIPWDEFEKEISNAKI